MESLDIAQIISGNSPAMAFGIICLVWMRSDRAAALEDAKAYAKSLEQFMAQGRADQTELLRAYKENTEASVKLERRIHEQNNILQRVLGYFEDQRSARGRGEA